MAAGGGLQNFKLDNDISFRKTSLSAAGEDIKRLGAGWGRKDKKLT